MSVVFL